MAIGIETEVGYYGIEVVESVDKADTTTNGKSKPHQLVSEKAFANLCHFEWQLDDGIAKFFFLNPLSPYDHINAEHHENQDNCKTNPRQCRYKPPLNVPEGVQTGITFVVGFQYPLVTYRYPSGDVFVKKGPPIVLNSCKSEGVFYDGREVCIMSVALKADAILNIA